MHQKQLGFTLLELSITLILISLLALSVYFNWPSTTLNLSGQAEQIAADMRYAQTLSMTTGQRYRFNKAGTNTYQLLNSAGSAVSLFGNTTITLNNGMTFGTFTNLPNNLVVFDGKGIPYTDTSTPGTALATTAVITLSSSGQTTTVSITPGTGRVTVP